MNLLDGAPCDQLPVDDPAIGNGMAVFEALRTYERRPFRPLAHLERLRASAVWFGFACADDAVFLNEIEQVVALEPDECSVLVTLTGGGRRLVRSRALDLSRVGAPLRVATLAFEAPPWLPGWVKHTNRAGWVLAAAKAGVDEVLFVGSDGTWTEANRSNVFAVRDGVLLTPPENGRILRGVTRGALIEAAREAGVPVREAPLFPGPVDELYLASTLKELAPVVELNGAAAPGRGPVGERILATFRHRIRIEQRRA
ncbi:hypothetical protein LBMAG42_07970 [Deltaproteobacteria bacterium]|nr:hypothetical protein LBMAG42_07970 [Deltaproteobacteria bacterium]